MVALDMSLVVQTRRRKLSTSLDERQLMVMNLAKRRKVKVTTIINIFGCSKNTAYYRAFTGGADSYPNSALFNEAAVINAKVDEVVKRHGGLRPGESKQELQAALQRAFEELATPEEVIAFNAEMTRDVEERDAKLSPVDELPPATSKWLEDDA